MLTGTMFEDYEICDGLHCCQRQDCARWMLNVDLESPELKNLYINFNKKHWPQYRCPYFLKFPNIDYPVARLNQYKDLTPTPLEPEDLPY